MGLNIQSVVISNPHRQRTGGLLGRSRLSRVRYPRRSSTAEVSRGSVGRGSRGLRSLRAPPPGLSHGVARVPTRGCCGERGPDAAGPGAQRGALGCPPGGAARDCTGQSAACAPQASMAFTRKRQREQQLQLYSKERCAGREAGPGRVRQQPGALLQAAAASRAAEPRVGRGNRGSSGRQGRPVPAPARSPAGPPARRPSRRLPADPPRPAAGLRGRLLAKRVRQGGRGQPRPREDVGRAPASLRSRPLTGKRTSAPCVLPRAVFVTHAPAGDAAVVPTGMPGYIGVLEGGEIRGLLVGAGIGRSRCRSVDPAKPVMPGNAGAAFILGGFAGIFTCSYYSPGTLPASVHLSLICSGLARWSVQKSPFPSRF